MDLKEVNILNNYRHPWELSRRDSFLKILKKNGINTQYADIGAGDLFFAKSLKQITNQPVYAVDHLYCKTTSNIEGVILIRDMNDIPKNRDFLLLMDIFEHVEDDRSFWVFLKDKLNDGGRVLITVPAFQFLYSPHDKFLNHYRRYDYSRIAALLGNDFKIEEAFYFYTTLFFIRFIERILSIFKKIDSSLRVSNWRYSDSSIITVIIKCILDIDFIVNRYLSRISIKLPGISLCIICKKKSV